MIQHGLNDPGDDVRWCKGFDPRALWASQPHSTTHSKAHSKSHRCRSDRISTSRQFADVWQCYVLRLRRVEIHSSARKHSIDDHDIVHAVGKAIFAAPIGDADSPSRRLVFGPARSGAMLELIVLEFDDGREMVIHAMRMRKIYEALLRELREEI